MEKMKRPKVLPGVTRRIATGCGNMYVTITFHDGKPFEIFGILGKSGGCAKAQCEALTRCVTLGLRYGIPINEYIKQLDGIACPSQVWAEGTRVSSCPHAIVLAIRQTLESKEVPKIPAPMVSVGSKDSQSEVLEDKTRG